MKESKLKPVHPGEVLLEEFLKPMGLSQHRLALNIGVSPRRINEIVLGKRGITADTALRLGRYFGMSPQFWLGLQMDYELDIAEEYLLSLPSRRLPVECAFSPDGLFEARFRVGNTSNLREGEQLRGG